MLLKICSFILLFKENLNLNVPLLLLPVDALIQLLYILQFTCIYCFMVYCRACNYLSQWVKLYNSNDAEGQTIFIYFFFHYSFYSQSLLNSLTQKL